MGWRAPDSGVSTFDTALPPVAARDRRVRSSARRWGSWRSPRASSLSVPTSGAISPTVGASSRSSRPSAPDRPQLRRVALRAARGRPPLRVRRPHRTREPPRRSPTTPGRTRSRCGRRAERRRSSSPASGRPDTPRAATSRDSLASASGRSLSLIVFGIVMIFVRIPNGALIYAIVGLVIFAGLTVFDFQRLRRTQDIRAAPLLAASIFLDILNVFLLLLSLFQPRLARNRRAGRAPMSSHACRRSFARLDGATGWLNSPPLTRRDLRGKVVLVDFWTYTCINWLRTLAMSARGRRSTRSRAGRRRRPHAGIPVRARRRQRPPRPRRTCGSSIRSRSTATTGSGAPSTTATGRPPTSPTRRDESDTTSSARADTRSASG